MKFNIDKEEMNALVHSLAVRNEISDSQMAAFIYRNLYVPVSHRDRDEEIRRYAVSIANLTKNKR